MKVLRISITDYHDGTAGGQKSKIIGEFQDNRTAKEMADAIIIQLGRAKTVERLKKALDLLERSELTEGG